MCHRLHCQANPIEKQIPLHILTITVIVITSVSLSVQR